MALPVRSQSLPNMNFVSSPLTSNIPLKSSRDNGVAKGIIKPLGRSQSADAFPGSRADTSYRSLFNINSSTDICLLKIDEVEEELTQNEPEFAENLVEAYPKKSENRVETHQNSTTESKTKGKAGEKAEGKTTNPTKPSVLALSDLPSHYFHTPLLRQVAVPAISALANHYLNYRIVGLENIPKEGGAVLALNHSTWCLDIAMVAIAVATHCGEDPVILVHNNAAKLPLLREFTEQLGWHVGDYSEAKQMLKDGRKIIVMPGGIAEAHSPKTHQVHWLPNQSESDTFLTRPLGPKHPRSGFVRLSLETGAPICMIATPRADDLFEHIDHPLLNTIARELVTRFDLPCAFAMGPTGGLWPFSLWPLTSLPIMTPKPVELTSMVSKPHYPDRLPVDLAKAIEDAPDKKSYSALVYDKEGPYQPVYMRDLTQLQHEMQSLMSSTLELDQPGEQNPHFPEGRNLNLWAWSHIARGIFIACAVEFIRQQAQNFMASR